MNFVSSFAERFSELTAHQTCQQTADYLGISKATVSYYSSGERKPKTPALRYIAEMYNVDPVWLLGGDVPRTRTDASNEKTTDPKAGLKAAVYAIVDELPAEKLEILAAYLEGLKER